MGHLDSGGAGVGGAEGVGERSVEDTQYHQRVSEVEEMAETGTLRKRLLGIKKYRGAPGIKRSMGSTSEVETRKVKPEKV